MKKLGSESGQTLVMVALSMTVLLGFAAFATDVGLMLHEKRMEQSATDSAAIAAALAMHNGNDVSAAGLADATLNGFTNGTDSNGYVTTVKVFPTPSDGTPVDSPFSGQAGYVEATITQQVPTFFMRVFGRNFMTVSSRAVATDKGAGIGCIYITDPTASPAMELQGSFNVNAPQCGIYVNSNGNPALDFTGNGGQLTAASVGVAGTVGGLHTGESTPIDTGIAQFSDPLAGKYPPPAYNPANCIAPPAAGTAANPTIVDPSLVTHTTDANGGAIVCYNGDKNGNISLTNVTLDAGTYVFNNPTGSLILSGNISGANVTLYLLGGMNEVAGTKLNLSAPKNSPGPPATTYTYDSILIYGAPTDVNTGVLCPTGNGAKGPGPGVILLDLGNSSGTFSGEIYAPHSDLMFQDSGGGLNVVTDIVVGTMCDETASLNITSFAPANGGGQFPRISLVE